MGLVTPTKRKVRGGAVSKPPLPKKVESAARIDLNRFWTELEDFYSNCRRKIDFDANECADKGHDDDVENNNVVDNSMEENDNQDDDFGPMDNENEPSDSSLSLSPPVTLLKLFQRRKSLNL